MAEAKTLIGIDGSSTKTGLAVIRDGKLIRYVLLDYSRYKDSELRITEMVNAIVDVLETYDPDVIYYEDTWVAQNPKSSLILTTILGGIRYWAVTHSCVFRTILPTVWRKYLKMNVYRAKRQELKQKSVKYVKDTFGIDVNDDVSDAVCIAVVGYKIEKENMK